MVLEFLSAFQQGYELGSAIFQTKHLNVFNQGMEYFEELDVSDPDTRLVEDIIDCFEKIDSDDKLYVRCIAWYIRAFCYATQYKWKKSYSMFSCIENAETNIFTLEKDTIRDIKAQIPGARNAVKEAEREWKEEQERLKREEQERRKLLNKQNNTIPTWVFVVIGILLVLVIGLGFYIFTQ